MNNLSESLSITFYRSIIASDFSNLATMQGDDEQRRSVSSQTSQNTVKNFVKGLDDDRNHSILDGRQCRSCGEEVASVTFKPCGHKIVCVGMF